MGLVALLPVGSSLTRDWTHVPWVGRQILDHYTTRKPWDMFLILLAIWSPSWRLLCTHACSASLSNSFWWLVFLHLCHSLRPVPVFFPFSTPFPELSLFVCVQATTDVLRSSYSWMTSRREPSSSISTNFESGSVSFRALGAANCTYFYDGWGASPQRLWHRKRALDWRPGDLCPSSASVTNWLAVT